VVAVGLVDLDTNRFADLIVGAPRQANAGAVIIPWGAGLWCPSILLLLHHAHIL